ncbi:hypothetical protein HD806DRAFT_1033 [Xylariaceae sp. AK1471]|nr:hypothetical protein HD806DRAFT_1033 [Xylariaceae sp. AK1471]
MSKVVYVHEREPIGREISLANEPGCLAQLLQCLTDALKLGMIVECMEKYTRAINVSQIFSIFLEICYRSLMARRSKNTYV